MFSKPKTVYDITRGEDVKEDTPFVCAGCKKTFTVGGMKRSMFVCPECGKRNRIPARSRIFMIADENSFKEHDAAMRSGNPIKFPDYEKKIADAQQKTGEIEAVITGEIKIKGMACCIFAMDSRFMMASMGSVVGEKISRIFEYATKFRLPVLGYCCSGGARMQEGMVSLMQMAKTSAAAKYHSDAGNFYCSVLTDPTTGGVTASFAMLGDVILAEPGALVGFAGKRVIEQTTHSELPPTFQKAEFQKENGFVDEIVPIEEQRDYIYNLLRLNQNRSKL